MNKQIKIVVAIAALIIGIASSWHLKANNKSRIETVNINKESEFTLEENKEKLEKQKKKFFFEKNEFTGGGIYTYITDNYNSLGDSTLSLPVYADGRSYLTSTYYGRDWLFHTKVMVRVGNIIKETEEIPIYSDNHSTANSSDLAIEINTYRGHNGNEIIKLIAENYDKEIKVRFVGKYYIDIKLSNHDKTGIKESHELSKLLKGLSDTPL